MAAPIYTVRYQCKMYSSWLASDSKKKCKLFWKDGKLSVKNVSAIWSVKNAIRVLL